LNDPPAVLVTAACTPRVDSGGEPIGEVLPAEPSTFCCMA
jgi:hypothetical protein